MSMKHVPDSLERVDGTIKFAVNNIATVQCTTFNQSRSYPTSHTTPDFAKFKRNGNTLPMHPYLMTTGWGLSPLGECQYLGRYEANINMHYACGYKNPIGYGWIDWRDLQEYQDVRDDLSSRAVRSLYESASNGDLSILVSVGEAPKTFGLIGQTATKLAKTLKSLKRGDVSSALSTLGLGGGAHKRNLTRRANTARKRGRLRDFAADSWLEVKYGWKPLLQDIEDGAKATAEGWINEPADVVLQAGKRRQVPLRIQTVPAQYNADQLDGVFKSSLGYTVHLRVLDQATRNLQGLGLLNLAEVGWELIPYSFVLDWFIPVGAFISAQTAFAGTEFVRGCESEYIHRHGSVHFDEFYHKPADLKASNDGIYMRRDTLESIPSSTKILHPTSLDRLMNFDKAITGLALLHSAYR